MVAGTGVIFGVLRALNLSLGFVPRKLKNKYNGAIRGHRGLYTIWDTFGKFLDNMMKLRPLARDPCPLGPRVSLLPLAFSSRALHSVMQNFDSNCMIDSSCRALRPMLLFFCRIDAIDF